MKAFIVVVALVALVAADEGKVEKRGSAGYAQYGAPAVAGNHYYSVPAVAAAPVAVATYKSGAPVGYSNAIPAAAIRNVETVGVTKTITPVVTKTTTYNTHSEPAVSVGHVQGYSQSAVGSPKIAPVQFTTQYTSYQNPTVGVNGPVTYAGPAVATGLPVQQAVVAQPVYAQQAYAAPAYAQQAYAAPVAAYQQAYAPAAYAGLGLAGYSGYNLAALGYAQPQLAALGYAQPQLAAYQQAAYAVAQPAYAYQAAAVAAPVAYQAQHAHHAHQAQPAGQYGAPVVSSQTYAGPSVNVKSH